MIKRQLLHRTTHSGDLPVKICGIQSSIGILSRSALRYRPCRAAVRGCGPAINFYPRRNISGFVDLAPFRATAPAGKDCAGVDLSHASLYTSSTFRFRLSFSSTLAGRGSWAVLTTDTSPVERRAIRVTGVQCVQQAWSKSQRNVAV